jgi:hypothetical protein
MRVVERDGNVPTIQNESIHRVRLCSFLQDLHADFLSCLSVITKWDYNSLRAVSIYVIKILPAEARVHSLTPSHPLVSMKHDFRDVLLEVHRNSKGVLYATSLAETSAGWFVDSHSSKNSGLAERNNVQQPYQRQQ